MNSPLVLSALTLALCVSTAPVVDAGIADLSGLAYDVIAGGPSDSGGPEEPGAFDFAQVGPLDSGLVQHFARNDFENADVLNTAELDSIVLLDGSGSPVNGNVSSNSGANYNPFVVPEPSTALLSLLGALALVHRRRA